MLGLVIMNYFFGFFDFEWGRLFFFARNSESSPLWKKSIPWSSSPLTIAQPLPCAGAISSSPSHVHSTAGSPSRVVKRQSIWPWTYPKWNFPLSLSSNSKYLSSLSSMNSWSQVLIETMRQRPVKRDDVLGFDFATVRFQIGVTSLSFPELPSVAATVPRYARSQTSTPDALHRTDQHGNGW